MKKSDKGLEERLNSPMRLFIDGKFEGETDQAEEPKDRLKKIVEKRTAKK